ncbi:MAG: TlpA disulfide reductase family protein [Armatimonadota bacterium]|nr:TlpA disulfide reductase family protein [Armatimonadota bacterium]
MRFPNRKLLGVGMRQLLMWWLVLGFAVQAGADELRVGSKAPVFEAKDPTGKTVKLADFRGRQHVLLVVWSKECPVSAGEMEPLQKLHQEYQRAKEKPLVVLGMNIDETKGADVARWMKERKLTFPTVCDDKRAVLNLYGATVTPTFFLIDKDGVIQAKYASGGETVRRALAEDVAELVRDGKVTPREQPVLPTVFG